MSWYNILTSPLFEVLARTAILWNLFWALSVQIFCVAEELYWASVEEQSKSDKMKPS